ncbi:MAG: KpsF/GutQ family sugar-phosphate isomerase [Kiritimatiellia bacterium]
MDYLARAREIMQIEIDGLQKVSDRLGEGFEQAVKLLLECLGKGGKIVVTGIGKNLPIAEKISATLASTGSTSVALNPVQAMHGDLGILKPDDTLLALSYSGESEEIINLIPLIRRNGLRIIALTGDPGSALGKHSDVVIPITVDREACPFNMAPTATTTVTLAVGDALALVLLETRGFNREDYAKLHPSGAIGRTLLLRVGDIMRTGNRLASVPLGTAVREVLMAMTQARSGSAGIVDGQGRLIGVFTDGDLRRQLATRPGIMECHIDDVMIRNPICIHPDALAVDVLKLFETHKIDDILVVETQNGKLVGAIDVQDLPRLKIM